MTGKRRIADCRIEARREDHTARSGNHEVDVALCARHGRQIAPQQSLFRSTHQPLAVVSNCDECGHEPAHDRVLANYARKTLLRTEPNFERGHVGVQQGFEFDRLLLLDRLLEHRVRCPPHGGQCRYCDRQKPPTEAELRTKIVRDRKSSAEIPRLE